MYSKEKGEKIHTLEERHRMNVDQVIKVNKYNFNVLL